MPTSETRIAARDNGGVQIVYHHTTLPSKENVDAYETHFKGAAKIMLDMAQFDQREHWQNVRRTENHDFILHFAGMLYCLVLCLALIAGGIYLMATNHYVTGSASVVIALIAVVGSLAAGGKSQKQ